jgi:type 1 glutamine amidotransferase
MSPGTTDTREEMTMLRRGVLLVLGAACLLGATQVAVAADDVRENKPVHVLFVLGSPPFHDIRTLPPILEKVLDRVGGFQVTRLEPPKDKPPDNFAHLAKLADLKRTDYDVLLFYTSKGTLDPRQEQAIQKFVEDGGGIVGIHGASFSFDNSEVWTRLIGARFAGHIPGTHKLNIVIVDKDHPITAGVSDFSIIDEEYKHRFADVERHVLARFRERPPGSDPKANMDILWTREVGKGRMFYSALGHGKEAWENPSWQKLIVQGLYWAAGRPREVAIPAEK